MTDEEKKTVETGNQVDDNTQDYLAAIKELKENSVDRSKYDALKAENKRLIDSIVNGTDIGQVKPEDKESIKELREKVNRPHQTNLEYWTNVLKLRDALMEEGYDDPFVGASSQYTIIFYRRIYLVFAIAREAYGLYIGEFMPLPVQIVV